MRILVSCTNCDKTFRVEDRLANTVVLCPHCRADVATPRLFKRCRVKCSCGTPFEIPISDAEYDASCPKCSRITAAVGIDAFIDRKSPHFVPQESGGVLALGKVVKTSKAEVQAEEKKRETARVEAEAAAKQEAEEHERRRVKSEVETQGVGPDPWTVASARLAAGAKWCVSSWTHFSIFFHVLVAVVTALVLLFHHILDVARDRRLLLGKELHHELGVFLLLCLALAVFALVWALVLTFLAGVFRKKAAAAQGRKSRVQYPHLAVFLGLVEAISLGGLFLGLSGAVLSELLWVVGTCLWEWFVIPMAFPGTTLSLGGMLGIIGGILAIVFVYIAAMATIEILLTLVDIERNTAERRENRERTGGPPTPADGSERHEGPAPHPRSHDDHEGHDTGPYSPGVRP